VLSNCEVRFKNVFEGLIAHSGLLASNNTKDEILIKITQLYVAEYIPGSEFVPTVITSSRVSVVL
jgi:hypothetical protein